MEQNIEPSGDGGIRKIFKKYFIFFSPLPSILLAIGFFPSVNYWVNYLCNCQGISRPVVLGVFFVFFVLVAAYVQFLYFVVGAWLKDANCEYTLGVSYLKGQFVRKNNTKALKWLKRAADQGHSLGGIFLSTMYRDGKGVPPNEAEARLLEQRVAAHGEFWSLRAIGINYQYKFGIKKDFVQSYVWLRIAMLKAEKYRDKMKCAGALHRLVPKMTSEQMAAGQQLYTELAPFASASIPPTPVICIIDVPEGVAPLEVRQKWIGCELPLLCHRPDSIRSWTTYFTFPKGFLSFWWGVLRCRIIWNKGFPVDATVALEILGRSYPEAAKWYVENTQFKYPWTVMLFKTNCCSLIGDRVSSKSSE